MSVGSWEVGNGSGSGRRPQGYRLVTLQGKVTRASE